MNTKELNQVHSLEYLQPTLSSILDIELDRNVQGLSYTGAHVNIAGVSSMINIITRSRAQAQRPER